MHRPLNILQNLDPRTKLFSVIIICTAIFFLDKLAVCVCLAVMLFLFRLMVKVSYNSALKLKKSNIINLSLLAAFIIAIQTFFGGGLLTGIMIVCRVFSLVLVFPILAETTSFGALAASLNALGLQYRTAFIISSAFNQAPLFAEEARLIMDAQKLRGAGYFEKKGRKPSDKIKKIKAYAFLCIPLVLGAMRKSQISQIAMDSRAFGAYKTRSWLYKPKMKAKDYLFVLGCIIFVVFLFLFNYADYQF